MYIKNLYKWYFNISIEERVEGAIIARDLGIIPVMAQRIVAVELSIPLENTREEDDRSDSGISDEAFLELGASLLDFHL